MKLAGRVLLLSWLALLAAPLLAPRASALPASEPVCRAAADASGEPRDCAPAESEEEGEREPELKAESFAVHAAPVLHVPSSLAGLAAGAVSGPDRNRPQPLLPPPNAAALA